MTFRLATPSDCAAIAEIYNHYLGISTMDLEQKESAYYESILKTQDDREELWVTGLQQISVWGIIKKYSDRAGYRCTAETSVYCHPDHLRQGIGTKMKLHLMDRCRALGYHHLIARIMSDNEVSIHYNQRLGYTIVGVQREIGQIRHQWKDVTVMQCLL